MTTEKRKMTKKAFKEKEKRNEAKKCQMELGLPKTPKISEKLIKALFKYKNGDECGLRINAEFVEGNTKFPNTEEEDLLDYFKYQAINKMPELNVIPQIKRLKNGNPSIEYARIDKHCLNLSKMLSRMNLEIEKTSFAFTNPKYEGVCDIVALNHKIKSKDLNKKRIIIDLNVSSSINDKVYGWGNDNLHERWDITLKAIHYKMMAKYEWGIEDIPFYFMVFSLKNDWEFKVISIRVEEETLKTHYNNLKNIKLFLDETMKVGFTPFPNYSVCKDCPLETTCSSAEDIPQVIDLHI